MSRYKKETKPFYRSRAWLKCREYVLLRDNHLCQQCLKKNKLTAANTVHHLKPLDEAPELALDTDNLESICPACHNKEHPEKGSGKREPEKKHKAAVIKTRMNEEVW
ncbi:HNH endonuclease [Brevibacillus sp. DP1.3A]|uniref:HNH endonuclease n=1 Tax=Brevibacillus sp. DP1.3A TaxID=2738867 RepID=UPI00156B964C|nr:HNH endonuclease signature motif containing protein [Brevibacillus sp. DP1.3A]UED78039.1 HNH endonuclease [Brevibacillus sp. DP1.3A]